MSNIDNYEHGAKRLLKGSSQRSKSYMTRIVLREPYHDHLLQCRGLLEKATNARVSNSLVIRRALDVYRSHLSNIAQQPSGMSVETGQIKGAR